MRNWQSISLITVLLFALVPWSGCADSEPQRDAGDRDQYGVLPASVAGFKVTRGAAKGYIAEEACKDCHEDLWNSYQKMGMARSFYRLTPDKEAEDFGATHYQEATGYYYVMTKRDGKYYQKRYCRDGKGRPFAEHEVEVAWVVGSGNHVRTYLSQSGQGQIYVLPLSWYAGVGWAMSPGFDIPNHQRFSRPVTYRCMFCHNAYPEVPVGRDLAHVTPRFPKELPQGIGCQRCHGPGARHVEKAVDETATNADIRARILNPKNFTARQREDLCFACHLQPESMVTAAMPAAFGKPMFSHLPGDNLTDSFCYFDFGSIEERREKIEVNHHGYRLRWSRCYTESKGRLSCLSCHDPHRKVLVEERANHYRKKCLACHQLSDCQMEGMGTSIDPAASDCVSCHMFEARPRDVVNVTITDHFIRRKPSKKDLIAPLSDQAVPSPPTEPVVRYFEDRAPKDSMLDLYKGLAQTRNLTPARIRAWLAVLEAADPDMAEPHVDVARALGTAGELPMAIEILTKAARRFPDDFSTHLTLGKAYFLAEKPGVAVGHLRRARELAEDEPEIHLLLGAALNGTGDLGESRVSIERALQLRPNHELTWRAYAQVLTRVGDLVGAIAAYEKTIALNPDELRAYRGLAGVHADRGDWSKKITVLEQGATRSVELQIDLATAHFSAEPNRRDHAKAKAIAREVTTRAPSNGRGYVLLALTMVLSGDPGDMSRILATARRHGADPGCCNGLAALDSQRRRDRKAASKHLARFRQDLRTPTREPLRSYVEQIVAAQFR